LCKIFEILSFLKKKNQFRKMFYFDKNKVTKTYAKD
jgi:hypothetical protein